MSTPDTLPTLTASSVLRLSREGGVAHFPGLARPRRIECRQFSELQRGELQALLEDVSRACTPEGPPSGADRRVLSLSVEEDDGKVTWTRQIAEDAAPEALLRWWRESAVEQE
ncbi:MAG TPA: protealysin inhibitor emfourin [Halomonas sp.]|nr:protealysin inhibitor emfourin [Halomonas sp.]